MFKAMGRRQRIYSDVARQIEDAIISGELKPEEALPNERELATTFGISQRTLREALRIVEEKGLIETNQTGNVVKIPTMSKMCQSLELLVRLNKVSSSHLLELREYLDPIIAEKAVQRATEEDIKKLEDYLAEIKKNIDGLKFNWDLMLDVDRKIHIGLAEISGNQLFVWLTTTLIDHFYFYINSWRTEDLTTANKNFQSLSRIVNAIRNLDAKTASIEAKKHVRFGMEHIYKYT